MFYSQHNYYFAHILSTCQQARIYLLTQVIRLGALVESKMRLKNLRRSGSDLRFYLIVALVMTKMRFFENRSYNSFYNSVKPEKVRCEVGHFCSNQRIRVCSNQVHLMEWNTFLAAARFSFCL